MSQERLPPQHPEACLTTSRASSCKGGTLIAENVWTLGEHARRLSSPDGYRPESCPRCGAGRLHVHDHLERKPLGLGSVVVGILRYICANPDCGATWRILPAFVARHLWWAWPAVARTMWEQPAVRTSPPAPLAPARDGLAALESVLPSAIGEQAVGTEAYVPPTDAGRAAVGWPSRRVPQRTRHRWQKRLHSSARQLVVLLASRGVAVLRTLAEGLGLQASRDELVAAYARALSLGIEVRGACVAALAHRLERGIRLM